MDSFEMSASTSKDTRLYMLMKASEIFVLKFDILRVRYMIYNYMYNNIIHYMIVHNKVRAQRGAVHIVQSRLSQVEVGVAQLRSGWCAVVDRGSTEFIGRLVLDGGTRGNHPPPLALKSPPTPCVAEPASHGEPIETTASDPIGDSSDALGNAFTREILWTLEVPTLLLLEFKEAFCVLFLFHTPNLISEPFPS